MLDHTQPPARRMAQMLAITGKKKLPDYVAEAMAQRDGVTASKAEAMADGLSAILKVGEGIKISADELIRLVGDLLDEEGGAETVDAPEFRAKALDRLSALHKSKGDIDTPMHGRETDRSFVTGSHDHGAGLRAKMVAGLLARLDPKTATAQGRDAAQMTVPQIAMAVCRANGLRPFNDAEAVRMAAHSTSDFPLILENTMSNLVARQLGQRMPDLVRASHEVARMDYRAGNSVSLSATGMPQEVSEGGEVKFVTVAEGGEALPALRDFASGFNITNQALQNDATALGLIASIATRMTQGAVERLRQVLLEPLAANSGAGQTMRDGLAMFHADHGNLAATPAALSLTSLSVARTAMRKQKGKNGELLALEPWALVVPAELETVAQQVVASINATKFSDANPFAGSLEIVVEPGLPSATAWYLIANPTQHDGLAHAFLDGQRSPRVETRPGWSTLGTEMRLVWALDAKFIETATWFKNAGA